MPTQKFLRESQELTFNAIVLMGDVSAYDVMDEVAAGLEGNKAFAMRQRVSSACSELHKAGRVHKIGRKTNPSSGEQVNVYREAPEGVPCPCGACPGDTGEDGDGAGYKARYEALLTKYNDLLAQTVPICASCSYILCDHCKRARAAAIK
jgi:hypothetical protein